MLKIGMVALAAMAFTSFSAVAESKVQIVKSGGKICISSNGTPDHSIGKFPNSGNPHRFKPQSTRLCVTANPSRGSRANYVPVTGIANNGVFIRPGTADYYDSSSRRGHSRDRSSGWRLEGVGSGKVLGLDHNLAHVDKRGIYHYHGLSSALKGIAEGTRIGWAVDGHEIHYVPSARSSWRLKRGTRPTEPFGRYDGKYEQDFEFIAGSGSLDECNGAMLNGKYTYFATSAYPFFPRCVYGTEVTRMRP